jgi:hypothetical protein
MSTIAAASPATVSNRTWGKPTMFSTKHEHRLRARDHLAAELRRARHIRVAVAGIGPVAHQGLPARLLNVA